MWRRARPAYGRGMGRLRLRSGLSTAIVLVAGVLALAPSTAAAAAVRPPAGFPSLPQQAVSPHFIVHYTTTGASTITPDVAATLSANAEQAYSRLIGEWGYPPPMDDGDGKTDIYVAQIPGLGAAAGRDDQVADHTTGFVILPPVSAPFLYAVAHEFFHVIQFGIWTHEQSWLTESTAEWAGQNVFVAGGGQAPPNWYPHPWVPLDCTGSACADGDSSGYRGSIFMEYLDERFGMGIVNEVFGQAAALGAGTTSPHSLQALGDAIAAHGTSLGDVLDDYAVAAVAGTINRPGVTGKTPSAQYSLVTGNILGAYKPVTIGVDHLAFNTLLLAGNAADANPSSCQALTLTLAVDLPPGVLTRPTFVATPAGPPAQATALAVSGSTASIMVPWSDCSSSSGALVLPNGSTSLDGQGFVVHVTVARPASAKPSNHFTTRTKTAAKGAITLTITTAAPGRITAKATAVDRTRKHKRARTVTYATRTVSARRAGRTTFTLKPTSTAKKLLKRAKKLKLTIRITFTPTGGTRATTTKTVTVRYTKAK